MRIRKRLPSSLVAKIHERLNVISKGDGVTMVGYEYPALEHSLGLKPEGRRYMKAAFTVQPGHDEQKRLKAYVTGTIDFRKSVPTGFESLAVYESKTALWEQPKKQWSGDPASHLGEATIPLFQECCDDVCVMLLGFAEAEAERDLGMVAPTQKSNLIQFPSGPKPS